MFTGFILALLLVDSDKVICKDGSRVIVMKHPTWHSEFKSLWETLSQFPWIVLLFPMFLSSNWFYTYQQNSVNPARFDTRTRALNGLLYWLMQLVAALFFGYGLDFLGVRRAVKARVAWWVLFVLTMAIWEGGYAWQKRYTREDIAEGSLEVKDWDSSGYVGPMFLYMFYGFYDACWQTYVYWSEHSVPSFEPMLISTRLMGAMTNNSRRLADFVGFYKSIQSAGAAVVFRIDALGTSYMAEFISCRALLGGSLICALPVIWLKIQDTFTIEEDLKFSDESVEDVMSPNVMFQMRREEPASETPLSGRSTVGRIIERLRASY